jgi:hypothetical protein
MKTNDKYLAVLATIVVICLIVITIKIATMQNAKPVANASVTLLPPVPQAAPNAPAPRRPVGFLAKL